MSIHSKYRISQTEIGLNSGPGVTYDIQDIDIYDSMTQRNDTTWGIGVYSRFFAIRGEGRIFEGK